MLMCIATLIASLFTIDKNQVNTDKILSVNLIILSSYAVTLSVLINFDYYVGYYNKQILYSISRSYLPITILINYQLFYPKKNKEE
jgi:hypothetical protein